MNESHAQEGGRKFDNGKLRMDLICPWGIEGLAMVLTIGAAKYGDRNWERGIKYGRVFAACMRHLWAWWRGEMRDPEDGLPHLHHAMACVMFLAHYELRDLGFREQWDDRPGGGNPPPTQSPGP